MLTRAGRSAMSAEGAGVSVGQALQAARTEAGLSIDEVAAATRIRATIVRAIEKDEFALCGGDVYARGHIRSIAGVVGADSSALVAEFDAERGRPSGSPLSADLFEAEVAAARVGRRGPSWTVVLGVLLAALIAVGFFQLLSGSGGPRQSSSIASGLGATPSSSPTPSDSPTPSASPSATSPSPSTSPTVVAENSAGAVSVDVATPRGKSWVQVTNASGQVLFTGLMNQGVSKSFTDASQLKLVIGNAGSVDLTVNGKDIGTPGKVGEVVRLSFGPNDPAAA